MSGKSLRLGISKKRRCHEDRGDRLCGGDQDESSNSDSEDFAGTLDIRADRVEVVTSSEGDSDVMDVWWRLTAKGVNRIVCVIAEMTQKSQFRLTGYELRLCGQRLCLDFLVY